MLRNPPPTTSGESPVGEWSAAQEGFVMRVVGSGAFAHRLEELGVTAGAWIRVLRPGNPLLVQVGETRLCLRGDEGLKVMGRRV